MNHLATYIPGIKSQIHCLWISVLVILFLACPAITVEPAQIRSKSNIPSENEMKAAYLYNFLKFVSWPQGTCKTHDGKLHQIAVLGDVPFKKILTALQEKLKKADKDLSLTFYGSYQENIEFDCCCLLFIAESEKNNLPEILTKIEGKPILTVADSEKFLDKGVMITLVSRNKKIRWGINRRPVNDAGLKLRAKLLDIAVEVIDE